MPNEIADAASLSTKATKALETPRAATALNSTPTPPASRSHGAHRIRSTASSTARLVRLHFPSLGVSLPAACRYPPGHRGELTQTSSMRSGTRGAQLATRLDRLTPVEA